MNKNAKYQTPDEMQIVIDNYFADCKKRDAKYTMSGMRNFLGFACDSQIADYKSDHPEFSEVINHARSIVEQQREEDLSDPNTKNSRGIGMVMQNCHGWKNQQTIEVVGAVREMAEQIAKAAMECITDDAKKDIFANKVRSILG